VRRIALLDRDGGGQPLDQIDVGLVHQLEELTRVRRQGLDIAPLSLGILNVQKPARIFRAAEAGDHHDLAPRYIKRNVLEIVLARADDSDDIH